MSYKINNNRKVTKGRNFYNKTIEKVISYSVVPKQPHPEYDMEEIKSLHGKTSFKVLRVRKVLVEGEDTSNKAEYKAAIIMCNLENPHNYNIIPQILKTSKRIMLGV